MRKQIWIAAAGFAIAIAQVGAAEAQGRRPTPTPTPAPTPAPWTDPTSNNASSSYAAGAASAAVPDSGPITSYRPEGRSVGIGAGWSNLATNFDLDTPNTASVRFRLGNGLALEPIVGVGISSASTKVGDAKTSETGVDLFAGSLIRKTMASRGRVEANLLLGGGLSVGSQSSKVGDAKASSTSVGLDALWGVGVEWFPKTNWGVSFDATNPALSVVSASEKVGDAKSSSTSFFVGAIFDPTVRLMTHIYY